MRRGCDHRGRSEQSQIWKKTYMLPVHGHYGAAEQRDGLYTGRYGRANQTVLDGASLRIEDASEGRLGGVSETDPNKRRGQQRVRYRDKKRYVVVPAHDVRLISAKFNRLPHLSRTPATKFMRNDTSWQPSILSYVDSSTE